MGRKPRSWRNRGTTSRVSVKNSNANEFTAPTSGLESVMFNQSRTCDAAKFTNTFYKLARYLGIQSLSQSTVATKVIIELVELVAVDPAEPVRKYYLAIKKGDPVPNLRVQGPDGREI